MAYPNRKRLSEHIRRYHFRLVHGLEAFDDMRTPALCSDNAPDANLEEYLYSVDGLSVTSWSLDSRCNERAFVAVPVGETDLHFIRELAETWSILGETGTLYRYADQLASEFVFRYGWVTKSFADEGYSSIAEAREGLHYELTQEVSVAEQDRHLEEDLGIPL
jgi:hypothetical protein